MPNDPTGTSGSRELNPKAVKLETHTLSPEPSTRKEGGALISRLGFWGAV